MKAARAGTDCTEQGCLRRSHPHLSATFEPVEQNGPAIGIEMGRDLVKQQDRCGASLFGDHFRMGQNQAEQQRLLLAGGAAGGGLILGDMGNDQILAMRTFQCSSG